MLCKNFTAEERLSYSIWLVYPLSVQVGLQAASSNNGMSRTAVLAGNDHALPRTTTTVTMSMSDVTQQNLNTVALTSGHRFSIHSAQV